jgi:hypothetical protein
MKEDWRCDRERARQKQWRKKTHEGNPACD